MSNLRIILRQLPQYFFLLCGLVAIIAGNGCTQDSATDDQDDVQLIR
jgi:hypothetical protein